MRLQVQQELIGSGCGKGWAAASLGVCAGALAQEAGLVLRVCRQLQRQVILLHGIVPLRARRQAVLC